MFDQMLVENTVRTRRPLAIVLSLAGQVFVASLTILLPLLRTEMIGPSRMLRLVTVPLRNGEITPVQRRQPEVRTVMRAAATRQIFAGRILQQPAEVPKGILLEEAPQVGMPAARGAGISGVPDGVPGAIEAAMDEVPSIAKPRFVEPPPIRTLPIRVGGDVQAAKILTQVAPVYPALAKQARISGVVRLEAVISRNGFIESLRVKSGYPLLTSAAVDAVRKWIYRPTLLNGEPVEVLTEIEVNFRLNQ